jgi:hypothetical protein
MLNIDGEVTCKDPSVYGKYSQGLLVERKALEEFLNREELALFWVIEGDKMVMGNLPDNEYPGRLDIRGIYVLLESSISGNWKFNASSND